MTPSIKTDDKIRSTPHTQDPLCEIQLNMSETSKINFLKESYLAKQDESSLSSAFLKCFANRLSNTNDSIPAKV